MKTYADLLKEIEKATDEGLTMEHAERVAALALFVMNDLSEMLSAADKNRRMRKQGVKGLRSALRLEEIRKHDKKPSEGYLEDIANSNALVANEETSFDDAEVVADELTRQYNIGKESHLYFRSVAKGTFSG